MKATIVDTATININWVSRASIRVSKGKSEGLDIEITSAPAWWRYAAWKIRRAPASAWGPARCLKSPRWAAAALFQYVTQERPQTTTSFTVLNTEAVVHVNGEPRAVS